MLCLPLDLIYKENSKSQSAEVHSLSCCGNFKHNFLNLPVSEMIAKVPMNILFLVIQNNEVFR